MKRILVAEDTPMLRRSLQLLLPLLVPEYEGKPVEFDFVEDGDMALEQFKPGLHHVLLTDYNMPRMDGGTLARAVRDAEHDLPFPPAYIILHSADRLVEYDDTIINAFVPKPALPGTLTKALTTGLDYSKGFRYTP